MHPDRCSNWKQRGQPEFVGPPGGPTSTVAISHFNPGGRPMFMGKVGDDYFGNNLVLKMNVERVQACALEIDSSVKTAASNMKFRFQDDGGRKKLVADTVKGCAEDSFVVSGVNLSVLKEVPISRSFRVMQLTTRDSKALHTVANATTRQTVIKIRLCWMIRGVLVSIKMPFMLLTMLKL